MAQSGPKDPSATRRFVVKVKPEHLRLIPVTAFDPTPALTFETRERAEGWCEALNKILGYSRFMVAEAESPETVSPSEQRATKQRKDPNSGKVSAPVDSFAGLAGELCRTAAMRLMPLGPNESMA